MRKILIVAYACEPFKGSEQGVGWNWSLELAKNNQVSVITRANNQQVIENNIPEEARRNISFYYYDTIPIFLKLKNKAKGLYAYYTLWQLGVLPLVKKLDRERKFDCVFQPTMGSLWMPTFLPFLNIPFIWGPLGGGECVPYTFLRTLPFKDRCIQTFRYFLKYLVFFNPLILLSFFKSQVIVVRTPNTLEFIPSWFRKKVYNMLETAMDDGIFEYKKKPHDQDCIKLIMTGRLIPIKNTLPTLKALFNIPKEYNLRLLIVGSGSEEARIRALIANNPYSHEVILKESLPRVELLKLLSEADICLFPSLHEGGSWTLMEAMAIGLPVVCLNWTGNAIVTDKSSAVRLDVKDPEGFCTDMQDAICSLAKDAALRQKIGQAARQRIKKKFSWAAKAVLMEEILEKVSRSKKNSYGH